MFDIGWTELLVVAAVAILIVGPRELPRMLRTFGQTMGKLRRMAREFQSQFEDALKEAELDEVKSSVENITTIDPLKDIKSSISDTVTGVNQDLKSATKAVDEGKAETPETESATADAPAAAAPSRPGLRPAPGYAGSYE